MLGNEKDGAGDAGGSRQRLYQATQALSGWMIRGGWFLADLSAFLQLC